LTRRSIPIPIGGRRPFTFTSSPARSEARSISASPTTSPRRVHEHRTGIADGFTKKYGVFRLVYVETFPTAIEAIQRETTLKRWKRQWKIELIEQHNPKWFDLYRSLNR
jgi:putative endonuclease